MAVRDKMKMNKTWCEQNMVRTKGGADHEVLCDGEVLEEDIVLHHEA